MKRAAIVALAVLSAFPLARAQEESAAPDLSGEIERLVRDLGAESWEARERAVERLARIGEPAEEAVRRAAEDADPEVRTRAEWVLAAIRERAAVERLVAGTLLPDEVRDLDPAAIRRFLRAEGAPLAGADPDVLFGRFLVLRLRDDPETELYYTRDSETVAALEALAAKAVPALLGGLESAEWQVRFSSLVVLARVADATTAAPVLALAGSDPHPWVRTEAAWILGRWSHRPAAGTLVALLADPDATVRFEACQALVRITGESLPAMPRVAPRDDPEVERSRRAWQEWWDGHRAEYE
ncbi:MAG: HEAT repeat domain-containing protein [Planctomycetes bacterium]|nr:HEAT repeat domain-containing protein [Planctomycetota bacterium]